MRYFDADSQLHLVLVLKTLALVLDCQLFLKSKKKKKERGDNGKREDKHSCAAIVKDCIVVSLVNDWFICICDNTVLRKESRTNTWIYSSQLSQRNSTRSSLTKYVQ